VDEYKALNRKWLMSDTKSLQEFADSSPFIKHLGVNVIESNEGHVKMTMKVQPFFSNTQGMVHGGVLSSFADIAGGFAVITKLKEGQITRTMQMDIHYLAPARGLILVAIANVSKIGSLLSVSDVEIKDESEKVSAMARCTYVVVETGKDDILLDK